MESSIINTVCDSRKRTECAAKEDTQVPNASVGVDEIGTAVEMAHVAARMAITRGNFIAGFFF